MRRDELALAIAMCAVAGGAPVRAQEAPSALEPPRVLELPDVELPPDVAMPEGNAVDLRLRIDARGAAEVEECDAPAPVCDRVREAVAEGRFAPATRGGEPVEARIGMRFTVERAEPPPAETSPAEVAQDDPERAAKPAPPLPLIVEDAVGFGATASVEAPARSRLELADMFEVSGGFDGAIREVGTQPGITPAFSGVPYFYVRGSPPSGTRFYYDGIDVPFLYHVALGPPVVHPRLVGSLRMWAGVPPARYGRLIGGVVAADGPSREPIEEAHGEIELRALDSSAMIRAPVGDGTFSASARYGYPWLLLRVFQPSVHLEYGDYQVRFEHPLTDRDHVELVALGAADDFGAEHDLQESIRDSEAEDTLQLHFHRFEARLVRRTPQLEVGTALRVGWEQAGLDGDLAVEALTLGPRMWLAFRTDDVRLRAGAEVLGATGDVKLSQEGLAWGRGPRLPARTQLLSEVAARNVGSVYAELGLAPHRYVSLDLGVRTDAWRAAGNTDVSFEPRARGVLHVTEDVDLELAAGVVRQPSVFFVPLPGLSHVAIDRGLQTALQGEIGARARLPLELEAQAHLFVHRYHNLLFPDLFLEAREVCTIGRCIELPFDRRIDGVSYGGEVFVDRSPEEELSGFVSYTLAWAEIDPLEGIQYTPSYDVRHVLNAAGRWSFADGWNAAIRAHYRTGKPFGVWGLSTNPLALHRYEQRLPSFFRMDARLAYTWRTSFGKMRVTAEWLNVTLSREPVAVVCQPGTTIPPEEPCPVDYTPAVFVPNVGIGATF